MTQEEPLCWDRVTEAFLKIWPIHQIQNLTSLVAVSGGADSVALLLLANHLKHTSHRLIVAHFNHNLRGEDSAGDQQFVIELAEKLKLQWICDQSENPVAPQSHQGDGLEAIAREQRYQFLQSTAHSTGARYVAVGHHLQDQRETVLHRVFRGTGLHGLQGIQSTRPLDQDVTLIRPLLNTDKNDLLQLLKNRWRQSFRCDASNKSMLFTRNRIRHELIPLLDDLFHQSTGDRLDLLRIQATEITECLQPEIDSLLERTVTLGSEKITIQTDPLQKCHRWQVAELIRQVWRTMDWPQQQMNRDRWNQLAELVLEKRKPTEMLPGKIRVSVTRNEVTIAKV